MSVCGVEHPEDSGRTCIVRGTGKVHIHMDRQGPWRTADVTAHIEEVQAAKRNTRSAAAKRKTQTRGALGGLVARVRGPQTGIPAEAEEAWSKEHWVSEAEGIFVEFLRQRVEPFTTAEHVWPLLDAPEEMRALSLVVQRLIKIRAMEECGAVRLKGVYSSRDGVEFAENKLVPIYRSLLVESTPATPARPAWGTRDTSISGESR